MPTTVEIGSEHYSIGKLPALKQFHVMRRIAPLLESMQGDTGTAEDAFIGKVLAAVGKMSDEDTDYVVGTCLSVCSRQVGTQQAPVASGSGATFRLMFEDMDMATMIRLTIECIKVNIGSFFGALPDGASAGA